MKNIAAKKSLLVVPLLLAIASCGGGGSSTIIPQDATQTTFAVSGIAAKGPMLKAIVKLYKVKSDGTKGELLASVVTDETDGSYSATIENYTGVVVAEVSVGADTLMIDEATKKAIAAPTGLTMRASFPTVVGTTSYSTQINPFTEMATVQAANAVGGLTESNVVNKNRDMASALNLNPLTTAPTFDGTTGKPTNPVAAALTSVSKMASDGTVKGCTTGDQTAKVLCVVNELKATAATLVSGVGVAASSSSTTPAITQTLQKVITEVNNTAEVPVAILKAPSTEVETLVSNEADAIEKAKRFFRGLRSNLTALTTANDNAVTFKSQIEAFQNDFNESVAPASKSAIDKINLLREGIDWYYDVVVAGTTPFSTQINLYDKSVFVGTCGFQKSTSFANNARVRVIATSKDEISSVWCSSAGKVQSTLGNCVSTSQPCSRLWGFGFDIFPVKNEVNKYDVNSFTGYRPFVVGQTQPFVYIGVNPMFKSSVTVSRSATTKKVIGLDWSGDLAPTFSVRGTYTLKDGAFIEEKPTILGDKHLVAFSGTWIKGADDLEVLSATGNIDLIQGDKKVSSLTLLPGSIVKARQDADWEYGARSQSQTMLLKIKASAGSSTFLGELEASEPQTDLSGEKYAPTKLVLNGKLSNGSNEFFDGTFSLASLNYSKFNESIPKSVSNPLVTETTFNGVVNIPNRPIIYLSFAEVNREMADSNRSSIRSGQYRQNSIDASQVVNFSGTRSVDGRAITTLESVGGVRVVFDTSKKIHPITIGSIMVGEVNQTKSEIEYKDKTYDKF